MNPKYAVVEMTLGTLNLTFNENHLIDFTNTRESSSSTYNVVVQLYDQTALLLEAELINNAKSLTYRYGWANESMSRWYTATILKFNPTFEGTGVTLSVEGMAEASLSVMKETNPVEYKGSRIDEIVRRIAIEMGWTVGIIVPTQAVPIDATSRDNEKVYNKASETYQEFIEKTLIPDAVSAKTGEGSYVLQLVEDKIKGTTINFMPKEYKSEGVPEFSFSYVIGVPNEEVLSFSPEFDDVLMSLSAGTTLEVEGSDELTNDYNKLKLVKDPTYTGTEFVRTLGASSYSIGAMGTIARNLWEKAMALGYVATLELVGTIKLEPMQIISIIVLTPDGFQHHSSGAYLVVDVVDNISGGTWTTTATLSRNAVSLDDGTVEATTAGTNTTGGTTTYTGDMARFACDCATGASGQWGGPYCNGFPVEMNPKMLDLFAQVEAKVGEITVTSGVRCKAFNDSLPNSSPVSLHMEGCAIDCVGDLAAIQAACDELGIATIDEPGWVHMQYNG